MNQQHQQILDPIQAYAEELQRKLREFQTAHVRCGIIGTSGSGKSSLINAIAGERIARVGVVETTSDPQEYQHGGLIFVDLPGCGTRKWPRDSYIGDLGLRDYDCFLLITADRFREEDHFLNHELSRLGKACSVVRNKFDLAVADGAHDNGLTEAQVQEQILANIQENLDPDGEVRVYLTSARHPTRYGLPLLVEDIVKKLEGIKRDRFIADMGAYGDQALAAKRELAERRIGIYAGLAAANGANPIPGVDIAADVGILLKMGDEIAHIYGLTQHQVEFIQRLLGPGAIPILLEKVTQFAAKYLAKEGVLLLLKQIGKRVALKSASKWLPFVGPLIAAGIGWHATYTLGEALIDEAEALAAEILNEMKLSVETTPA